MAINPIVIMSNFKTFSLFICFLCLGSVHTMAQTFPTKHYTTREGLAQMQVLAVLEDSRGILWVGTKGGLSRYDGLSFKNYSRADGDSLVYDTITDLKEDSQGNIWICTHLGISKFDGATFVSWQFPNKVGQGSVLYFSKKDEILITTNTSKCYEIIKGKLVELKLINEPKGLVRSRDHFDFEKDKLIITYQDNKPIPRLYHYELHQKQLKFIASNPILYESYPHGDKGIVYTYQYTNSAKTEYWFLGKGQKERKLILSVDANTVKVHQTLAFNFAFGFQSKLSILEKGTKNFQQLAGNFLNETFIQVDKTGIWAGTETGLWRVMDNGLKYLPTTRDAVVWSMVEDKYNRLWTLHYNTAVPIKIHEGTKTTDLQDGYQAQISKQLGGQFSSMFYFHALKDQYQNLWMPSGQGLIRYDYHKYQLVFGGGTYSFFLAEDKKRNLIVSSVGGGINIVENKPPYKVLELREKDGLHPNQQMLCVFIDSKGKHWYGGGGGLTTYDYERKKAFRYKMKSDKVPFNSVIFITEDDTHNLWLGTTSGLFRYMPLSDSFVQVGRNTLKGYIKCVSILDKNHLICSNDESVFVLNLADYYQDNNLNIKTFNYNNGLMGLEPGQAGMYQTHDGKMWVTSSDVLSIFDPKDIDLSVRPTKAIFTNIDGQHIPFTKPAQDSVYQLPKGKIDGIRIGFGSTGFDKALKPKYSYQLDNSAWTDWQEEPFVMLFRLSKGKHIIKIKTQLLGEQKGLVPLQTSLMFSTDIYFWQSPNFVYYLLLMLGLLGGVLVIVVVRRLREKNQFKQMEEHEKELNFMRIAANQAQMSPHFIFNILQILQSHILQKNFKMAEDMLVKVSDLIRNYLEATLIDPSNKKKSIFSTEITIKKELELLKLFVEFEHSKALHKFDYEFDIDANIASEDISLPPMLIQPIVENAIGHGLLNLDDGQKGMLTISISYQNQVLCFIIKDTGVGFKRATEIKASKVNRHRSVGKKLVQQKIEILNKEGYKITQFAPIDLHPHGTSITVCFDFNE